MKKYIVLGAFLVLLVGLVAGWSSVQQVAAQIAEIFYGDPDIGPFDSGMSKEEFMEKRAEGINMLRGVEKDKPFDPQKRISALKELDQQEVKRFDMPASISKNILLAAWTEIGPNPIPNGQVVGGSQLPVSGRTVSIAVHPTNPNLVYAGAAQGGLYRSTDGGTTWTPLMDNAASLAIGAIAIAPSQPDTVYVGTGEHNFSLDSFFGVGVYRIDNASTASPTITGPLNKDGSNADIFTGRGISRIIVHPTNPAIIWVASTSGVGGISGSINNVLPNRGVYRSTNATAASPTFTQVGVLPPPSNNSVRDIAMDPGNPDIMIANPIISGGTGGIYRTTNAQAATPTWTQTFAFTGSTSTSNLTAEFAAIHPAADANATFYAAAGNNSAGTGTGRVLKSTDGGATFTEVNPISFCGGQCFYNIAVAVDPTNVNRVYLGGTGTNTTFAFSTNGGTSFTNSQANLHTDSQVITVAPSLPSTIYFGSDGGIYKSTDSGATWASLNNTTYRATQFMSIATHPTDPNFTIGGTQDNGTEFYRPNGTWTRADFGDGGYSVIDQSSSSTTTVNMFHTYFNDVNNLQGYAYITDGVTPFQNWTFRGCQSSGTTTNGITCNGSILFYAPLEQGPGTPNTIYYGSDRLYRSSDNGLNNTVVSQSPITAGIAISAIGISPQDDNVRIVGLQTGGIFGTTTGSSTLTDLDAGNAVPNNYIARTAVDPTNSNRAYVTLSAFGVTNVWKTSNLSNANPTWTAAATGLPQVPVSAFIIDPINPTTLYAGTDIGVYTSADSGGSWTPLGTGLPRVAVFDMAITNIRPRKLRIATHGRGMWEHPLSTTLSRSDFDGDGRSDLSIFRPTDGNWWINQSTAGLGVAQWGINGDVPVPGDYDGDGKTDLAVFRPDANPANPDFYVLKSSDSTYFGVSWGLPGDIPVNADYDGDGKTDFAIWRSSDTSFYVLKSLGGVSKDQFGAVGDLPFAMDFDGDGKANPTVYRPSEGRWYIGKPTGVIAQNFYSIQWGISTDMPVPADYDGDGKDDIAVFRPATGYWYILRSLDGAFQTIQWGLNGDVPVPGDYDGDGKADEAVYRNGVWYLLRSSAGVSFTGFGLSTDIPTEKKYIP